HGDGRAIDEDFRQLAAMAGDAVLAEIDLIQVLSGRDDGEQHVHVLELEEVVDHLAADLGQRLGLGAGAVPDGKVVTGLEQALGHGITHPAHADPTDLLLVRCHSNSPCSSPVRIPRSNSSLSSPTRNTLAVTADSLAVLPHAEEHRSASVQRGFSRTVALRCVSKHKRVYARLRRGLRPRTRPPPSRSAPRMSGLSLSSLLKRAPQDEGS